MKASTSPELTIRFVIDRYGRHHDVEGLHLRDILSLPDGRGAFRCACCFEPVSARAGFIRRPYFAHFPMRDESPVCAWRAEPRTSAFYGRNPSGDDGKWHIDAQCQIMTILEAMGCTPTRNAFVQTTDGARKPDIAATVNGQLIHFEVQSSPTDAWCSARRTDRDFRHLAVTLWIVSATAFANALEHNAVPSCVETLAALGGGQIWLWDSECYLRSKQLGSLSPLLSTIEDPSHLKVADLPTQLPRVVPFRARLNHAGRTQLLYPVEIAHASQVSKNLPYLRDALAKELQAIRDRHKHPYQYGYGLACLNTPYPSYTIFEDAKLLALRRWFDRQPRETLATFV